MLTYTEHDFVVKRLNSHDFSHLENRFCDFCSFLHDSNKP